MLPSRETLHPEAQALPGAVQIPDSFSPLPALLFVQLCSQTSLVCLVQDEN